MSAPSIELDDNSLVRGGFFFELQERLRLVNQNDSRVFTRAFGFGLAAFVPLVGLAAIEGVAWNSDASRSLLHDPTIYGRLLVAIPFFIMADNVVDDRFVVITSYFKNSGVITPPEIDKYHSLLVSLRAISFSRPAELFMMAVAYAASVIIIVSSTRLGDTTWRTNPDGSFTYALWWMMLFSLPLLNFLLLRWIWRFFIWISFLWRFARIKLHLISTHPDGAGGLGVLAESTNAFAPVFFGISAIISSVWIRRVASGESTVADFHYAFAGVLIGAVIIAAFPLLIFGRRLLKLKLLGLHDYGVMANIHSLDFDNKWIKDAEHNMPEVLGAPDISSLADLGTGYQTVQAMWFVPFRLQNIVVIIVSVAIPMIPLLLMEIPLKDLVVKIGGALL